MFQRRRPRKAFQRTTGEFYAGMVLFQLRLVLLSALLLLPLFMLGLFDAVLHVQHLIQFFPKRIILRCSDRFLLPQGGLLLFPARYVDLLHIMLFLQDALGGIIQVDLILMVSPELFSPAFPMDTIDISALLRYLLLGA